MASVFVPSKFKKLHDRLSDAFARSSDTRALKSNDWFVSVDRLKKELVDLGKVKPPNDAERKQIESGSIIIDGKSETLNADFAQHTLLLSRALRVSEQYAASLLQAGLNGRARYGQGALEVACILHHHERSELLSCLKLLLETHIFLQHASDPNRATVRPRLQQLLDSLLAVTVDAQSLTGPKKPVGLVQRILIEIDVQQEYAQHVKADLQGGSSGVQQHQSTQAPALRLSDDIQLERQKWIQHERRELGHILYLLAIARMLSEDDVISIANWLSRVTPLREADAVVIYVLAALLGALDTAPGVDEIFTANVSRATQAHLLASKTFITTLDTAIATQTWTLQGLQNVARLQWSLFLAEAFKRDPTLGTELRRHQQGLQALVIGAITGDDKDANGAFVYLVMRVLDFRRRLFDRIDGSDEEADSAMQEYGTSTAQDLEVIDAEFQTYILDQVQRQLVGVTSVMLPYLRKLQRAEEDAAFASSRSGSGGGRAGMQSFARRFDIEALFDLVALVCRGRQDAALPFWIGPDGRQSRFLGWAVEVREHGHQRALLDMLQSMAVGATSAWQAHSLLSSSDDADGLDAAVGGEGRLASWSSLFDWIQYYIDSLRPNVTQGATLLPRSNSDVPAGMLNEEVRLLCSFLRLLRNVVLYSEAARLSIYENVSFSAIPRLFGLYASQAHCQVKAALLDALAAFAQPSTSGSPSGTATTIRIVTELWDMLDKADVLGKPAPSVRAFGSAAHATGAYYELEVSEAAMRSFPSTTSFIKLLTALVHVPPRIRDPAGLLASPAALGLQIGSLQTPDGTNAPFGSSSNPRLELFVAFVVDGCLLQASQREYVDPAERWKTTAACLDFLERALSAYDLSPLLDGDGTSTASAEVLRHLVLHPGFSVLRRILAGGKLLSEILSIANPGGAGGSATSSSFDIINKDSGSTFFYASCVRHTLRIVQRIFQLQDVFLQVLLPLLSDTSTENLQVPADLQLKLGESGSLSPIDAHLLVHHQVVVQVALLVNCNRSDIALLAVRVLSSISRSTAFRAEDRFSELSYRRKMNRLVGLLEMSDETDRVCTAFAQRLDLSAEGIEEQVDEAEQVLLADLANEEKDIRIAGQSYLAAEMDGVLGISRTTADALRNTILEFLVVSTTMEQPSPNIAHLLLGYDIRATRPEDQSIADPLAPDTLRNCFHATLELLDVGNSSESDEPSLTIVQRNPSLAEKCLALVHNLCVHPYTSAATLRYLRTREDFFVRQVRALAIDPPPLTSSKPISAGTVIYADGRTIPSSVDSVVASLHCRTHILEGAALELHALSNAGLEPRAVRLVSALCGISLSGSSLIEMEDDLEAEMNRFIPGGIEDQEDIGETGMTLLSLLQSFDFEWEDARDALRTQLTVLASLPVHAARLPDNRSAVREYDLEVLLAILIDERHRRAKRGELVDAAGRSAFLRDSEAILHIACAHNSQRAITHARREAMRAWRHALDMLLSRSAKFLRQSARAAILFDCLSALLPRLVGPTPETDPVLAEIITGAVLSLLTALRQYRSVGGSSGGLPDLDPLDGFPIDKLIVVARALVEALLRPGSSALSRGNLYSALINYLNLVRTGSGDMEGLGSDGASVLGSEHEDTLSTDETTTLGRVGATTSTSLEARTYNLLSANAERLLPIIARDALDGLDIWRTLAFTLLDKLCIIDLSTTASKAQRVRATDLLDRQGYLKSFVAALRDMDIALQDVVRPDPASLNALYIYSSMLAFFNRLAQTKEGAEKLLNAKLFEVFAQSDFLATRPEREQDFVDVESFLPAATERYNALLTPALQVSVAILSSAAARNPISSASAVGYSPASHGAPRQALAFLNAHRDTILTLIKEPTFETTSIASIEQAQLVVSLLAFVLPSLEDEALVAPHPFAAFHSAVTNLAGAFLYKPAWTSRVVPHTDEELDAAQTLAPSVGTGFKRSQGAGQNDDAAEQTVFDVNAADSVRPLVISLLRYLESASESQHQATSRIRPVLTPSLFAPSARARSPFDEGEGSYNMRSGRSMGLSSPSLGSVLAALRETVGDLVTQVQVLEVAATLLTNPDSVRSDEWDDIVRSALVVEPSFEMGAAWRRRLAMQQVKIHRAKLQMEVVVKLDAIEVLLILLYRHFHFYLGLARSSGAAGGNIGRDVVPDLFLRGSRARGGEVSTSFGSSAFLTLGASDAATLGRESAIMVNEVLEGLGGAVQVLAATKGSVLPGVQTRMGFLEMAGRRLQECVGGEDEEARNLT